MSDQYDWRDFNEVADILAGNAGASGTVLAMHLANMIDNSEGNYTVYWPRDSIRVYESGSYEMAVFFAALLRDSRTKWYMRPTTGFGDPVISRVRRDLGPTPFADLRVIERGRVYKKDRILSFDIWFDSGSYELHLRRHGDLPVKLDLATIPFR